MSPASLQWMEEPKGHFCSSQYFLSHTVKVAGGWGLGTGGDSSIFFPGSRPHSVRLRSHPDYSAFDPWGQVWTLNSFRKPPEPTTV